MRAIVLVRQPPYKCFTNTNTDEGNCLGEMLTTPVQVFYPQFYCKLVFRYTVYRLYNV